MVPADAIESLPPNANARPADGGAEVAAVAAVAAAAMVVETAVAAAGDHRRRTKRRRDATAPADRGPRVARRAAAIPVVPVLVTTLAALCLAVVQSLGPHPYLGDVGRLAFWIEDELQGKF